MAYDLSRVRSAITGHLALASAAFGRRTAGSGFGPSKSKLLSGRHRFQRPLHAAAPVPTTPPYLRGDRLPFLPREVSGSRSNGTPPKEGQWGRRKHRQELALGEVSVAPAVRGTAADAGATSPWAVGGFAQSLRLRVFAVHKWSSASLYRHPCLYFPLDWYQFSIFNFQSEIDVCLDDRHIHSPTPQAAVGWFPL